MWVLLDNLTFYFIFDLHFLISIFVDKEFEAISKVFEDFQIKVKEEIFGRSVRSKVEEINFKKGK